MLTDDQAIETLDATRPLLLVKSRVPALRSDTVDRRRLLDLLDREQTPVGVVVAPAGWGKTTLLAQWASARPYPTAWLTLDADDDEPHRFWTYFITALQQAGLAVGGSALAALRVTTLDPLEVAVPTLLNDLAQVESPVAIVVDDFHVLANREIGEAVEYLATYLPPPTRLLIGARSDPPLPLALWRARGRLTEVRADDLRFEVDEAMRLVEATGSAGIDADVGSELVDRTEGWVAGLQLSVMAARGAPDLPHGLRLPDPDHPHLVDFVSSELLTAYEAPYRDLLLRSSVLDRLYGPMCDAALDITGSAHLLDHLGHIDPFVTRLEDGWFRCHSIVRDSLRREFVRQDPEGRRQVLRRAARWYLKEDEPEQAIRHVIEAGDARAAAELLLRYEDQFLDQGAIGTFLALAESLGSEGIDADRRLGVAMAWAAAVGGRRDRVPALLDMAQAAMDGSEPPPGGWTSLEASAAALRAIHGYQSSADVTAALEHAKRAAALEQDPSLPAYPVTRMALGLSLMGLDRAEDALPHLEDAWERSAVPGMPLFARLPIAGLLASCLTSLGRPEDAGRVLAVVSPLANRLEQSLGLAAGPAVGSIRLADAWLRMDGTTSSRDRLAEAVRLLSVASVPSQVVRALTLLAEANVSIADMDGARRAVAEARDIIASEPVFPTVVAGLDAVATVVARSAVRSARDERQLFEDLTDRELSILRALDGPLTQREIGRELYLSINTVKGYTKSLYRKLGVASRAEAVERARRLALI